MRNSHNLNVAIANAKDECERESSKKKPPRSVNVGRPSLWTLFDHEYCPIKLREKKCGRRCASFEIPKKGAFGLIGSVRVKMGLMHDSGAE